MACDFGHDRDGTVIHLLGSINEQDLDVIQHHFDQAAGQGDTAVILDFSRIRQFPPSLPAMVGALRLQARRLGISVELRQFPFDGTKTATRHAGAQ
ncbi:hypothetical protein A6A04_09580 [Paramagnetospirillum marisnigri]|uniref:STAS domain-containing protein n=1 Tax=Paramagnetospirillum marisnigri TaxID=1285242 RepID=A0A178M4F7_9PROT|nr:hypothetical protein [Paramagnetospirillum marisnigri]OAN42946.1 hypothetical protein A6A04_09580 [Paramagnetospirillum marisnigri]